MRNTSNKVNPTPLTYPVLANNEIITSSVDDKNKKIVSLLQYNDGTTYFVQGYNKRCLFKHKQI